MFEVSFRIALLKLLIYNVFHATIYFNSGVVLVNNCDALLDVEVDAFMDQGLSIQVISSNAESVACF